MSVCERSCGVDGQTWWTSLFPIYTLHKTDCEGSDFHSYDKSQKPKSYALYSINMYVYHAHAWNVNIMRMHANIRITQSCFLFLCISVIDTNPFIFKYD